MSLQKVKSGDPLEIPARTHNAFIDAARDHLARQQNVAGAPVAELRPGGIVPVKNASGADRERFDILGIDAPIFTPTDNEDGFKNQVALKGVLPTEADHAGRFAILLEPLKAGAIGLACVQGVCPVKVSVEDEDHPCADVNDGQAGSLKSGVSGAAFILWKESGTGEKWAVVKLGVPPDSLGSLFAVLVTKDGGVAGDAATDCTFTYTVKDLLGAELATALSPLRPRFAHTEYVEPGADSPGTAWYDAQGDLQLLEAVEEVPKTDLVAVLTSLRYDTTAHEFQYKKTSVRVIETEDEDAAWTAITDLTECDDT
ncbi:MAG TPA: hypothetical protein VM238_02750 [Phycisphaerae bacterium]|nr:hypothetical protein [Phycisphaerae bacterium]